MRQITRRTVLAAVPAAATAANSAVTIGLIGCGGRGRFDSGYMSKAPGARFVAVCDLFEERMELARTSLAAPGARRYSDYRELLASGVDAVLIATNEFTHPEIFEAAVEAGKHIYIEKPAAIDLEGCRRVSRANRTARPDRTIMFGFQQRYAPGYRKAKKLVESGGIGPMQMALSHWIKGAVTAKQPVLPHPANMLDKIRYGTWWRDGSGDIIVDTYVHGVDVLNWFLGGHPVKAVGAGGRSVRKSGNVMDHCTAIFSYPSGVDATLVGSQIAPLFYRAVNEQFFGADSAVETAREYWTHYRSAAQAVTEREPREITAEAVEEFVARIAGKRPINTVESAVESTMTAILGRMAIDGRREVAWEEMLKT
jgi:myo-inositol 2-dehydrogenase / D-chiro-inositol 1-dehydrogenase